MPWAVHAAGLGKLNVLSSLGQPLQAEIDLISVEKDELSSMTAHLASPEAYTEANIPYSSALVGVRVSIEKHSDGTPYIKISSIRAVNDPFIDFLIELSWAQGKLVRQYTALIDPPGFTLPGVAAPPMAVAPPAAAAPEAKTIEATPAAPETAAPAAPAAAAPPAPAEAGAAKPEEAAKPAVPTPEAAQQPQPAAGPEAAQAAAAKPAPSEYTVKRGDTLYKIAKSIKPEGVTVEQMLVSLYRSNPDAFVGNMNRLKAGKILRPGEPEQAAEVSQTAALKEIKMQTASWNAYRKALAEAAGATPAREKEQAATSGKITTTVEEQAAGGKAPQEVLKLSKGETVGKGGKPMSPQERVRALEEEATAREKSLAEANDRISQLEKQIQDMQHLLELKGMKVPPAAPAQQPMPAAPVKSAAPEAPKPESAAAPAAPAPNAAAPAAPVAAAPSPPAKPAPKKPKVVTPPPSLVDQILGQPLYLGGALVLLGGVGIGYWVMRRRQPGGKTGGKAGARSAPRPDKKTATGEAEPAGIVPAAMTQTATTPAAAVDDVDPIQEADLYLNFGRDAQAEEVLKEALEKNPKHEEAHLKLLQIYAGRKDKAAFEKTALMLKDLTGGKGDNWLKAAALGYSIDPANPLYADGKAAAPAAAAPAAAVDLDFDIDTSKAPTATAVDLEASPASGSLLQPGVATEIEDITHDSAAGKGPLVPDITFDAPTGESGTQTTDVALDTGAAPVNMIDFSLDAPAAGGNKDFAPDQTMAMHAGGQATKTGGMDFDVGEAKAAAPLVPELKLDFGEPVTSTPPPAIKLDDINLNLDAAPAKSEEGARDEHWFDVQTKFDLAKAYQEMGDKDGAREILQEVIKDGDAGQQEEARKLLDSLG